MKVLNALSPRERLLILIVLPLVVVFAGYNFLWLPLTEARAVARSEIASYKSITDAVANRSAEPVLQQPEAILAPLPTRIARSAENAGVLVRRLEPEGSLVRITLDDAQYDDVILWIANMEAQDQIIVTALEMDRRTAPGVVATRLTLEDSQ